MNLEKTIEELEKRVTELEKKAPAQQDDKELKQVKELAFYYLNTMQFMISEAMAKIVPPDDELFTD